MLLALALAARAHGDAAPAASAEEAIRAAATGTTLEAVLVVPHDADTASTARLIVADAATSAPIDVEASLQLHGPGSAAVAFGPSDTPGVHAAPWPALAEGVWAGALVVTAPPDLIAIDGIALHHDEHDDPSPAGRLGWPIALVAAVVLGWTIGRRGAPAVAVGVALLFPVRGPAHGGDVEAAAEGPLIPLEGQFLVGLRTERVTRQAVQAGVEGWGRLVASPTGAQTVRAPVSGTFHATAGLRPGATVSGSIGEIAEQPDAGERAARLTARADATSRLADAERALALALRDVEQAPSAVLSARDRLDRERTLTAARAAVDEARRVVSATGAGWSAPVPARGRVARLAVADGEHVEAGDVLAVVTTGDVPWAEVRVPQDVADELAAGAPARVTDPRHPGQWVDATLLDDAAIADPATATVTVTLALAPDDARGLLPGMAVSAWVPRGPAEDALAVPEAAVVESEGLPTVFVKTGPETFEARPVRLGVGGGGRRAIVSGLRPDERVVTEGISAVRGALGR